MPRSICTRIALLLVLTPLCAVPDYCSAQVVWSGFTKTFTKADGTDGTLAPNQDKLTTSVTLTRLAAGGMVNISAEGVFNQLSSPQLTEWATGINNTSQTITATNWQNLAFTSWLNAYGGAHTQGSQIAGRDAVVHIIPDNIYLDLRFSSWTQGAGGGFAYTRAEPPAPPMPNGDYNHNGVVDSADYVVWRNTLTQTAAPAGSGADGSGNGMIDTDDYSFWRQRFGNSTGSSAVSTIPEPAASLAVASALAFLLLPLRIKPGSRPRLAL